MVLVVEFARNFRSLDHELPNPESQDAKSDETEETLRRRIGP